MLKGENRDHICRAAGERGEREEGETREESGGEGSLAHLGLRFHSRKNFIRRKHVSKKL